MTLNNALAQQERMIIDLIQQMVDLNIEDFEANLTEYIRLRGIEKTINHIIFPFLERIGVLWITGHINPAQEHLVSNIIRQKLIVGTETVVSHLKVDQTGLLFMPEGEFHELGLLFIQYLLKSRGISVLYLGANVPIEDVECIIKAKNPDFLYTHLTSVSPDFNFDRFINQAAKKFENIPFIISGRLAIAYEKKIPEKMNFKRSLQEVTEFITTLN
jgi:methanogenic corrinoid protein MtbC1